MTNDSTPNRTYCVVEFELPGISGLSPLGSSGGASSGKFIDISSNISPVLFSLFPLGISGGVLQLGKLPFIDEELFILIVISIKMHL